MHDFDACLLIFGAHVHPDQKEASAVAAHQLQGVIGMERLMGMETLDVQPIVESYRKVVADMKWDLVTRVRESGGA